jgi:hypothetical protein
VNDEKHRETVLYAFAVEPTHDQKTLERYLRQHPELTDELIDLSFELRITDVEIPADASTPATDPRLNDAWREFLERKPTNAAPIKTDNIFARFKGQAFADLATSMKIPRSILTALRDRLVEPLSVPEKFLVRFAAAAGLTVPAIREFLAIPPAIIGTAQFKSDKKPTQQGRVSFQTLVESSQMTDEERQVLLQDWDSDELNRS